MYRTIALFAALAATLAPAAAHSQPGCVIQIQENSTMRNYVQRGDTLDLVAPAEGFKSGELAIVGNIAGVPVTDGKPGELTAVLRVGVVSIPAHEGTVPTQGTDATFYNGKVGSGSGQQGTVVGTFTGGSDAYGAHVLLAGGPVFTLDLPGFPIASTSPFTVPVDADGAAITLKIDGKVYELRPAFAPTMAGIAANFQQAADAVGAPAILTYAAQNFTLHVDANKVVVSYPVPVNAATYGIPAGTYTR